MSYTLTPSIPPLSNLNLSFLTSTSSLSRQYSKSVKPFGMVVFSTSLWNKVIGLPDHVFERQLDELEVTRIQNSSRPTKDFYCQMLKKEQIQFRRSRTDVEYLIYLLTYQTETYFIFCC